MSIGGDEGYAPAAPDETVIPGRLMRFDVLAADSGTRIRVVW